MGVDYFLACNDCKVFIDCHKWPPHEDAANVLWLPEIQRLLAPDA